MSDAESRARDAPRPATRPGGQGGKVTKDVLRKSRRDERNRIAAMFDALYPEWAATIRAMGDAE